ncbi:hypothetical protein PanWU01x14_268130 [Parasponia andersonii]|uniref:DUF7722 domain-containing protein n=1 Tax=Parasponia andersonii TaxID=3476 RepID=A0A2P5B6A2_PARAD|nr:hypothetical protein PanWU01x14_268130 [Parasponia andersonii]
MSQASYTIQGLNQNGCHHLSEQGNEGVRQFQMPLHYPRYKKRDYETMPEWKLDLLLREYGLPINVGDVNQKRNFAMGAFLWPSQTE